MVDILHGPVKTFWPMIIGCVLRTARSSLICNCADTPTSLLAKLFPLRYYSVFGYITTIARVDYLLEAFMVVHDISNQVATLYN